MADRQLHTYFRIFTISLIRDFTVTCTYINMHTQGHSKDLVKNINI